MLKRYRTWRDRRWWKSLDNKVMKIDDVRIRITSRHGRIIGVEAWDSSFGYYLFKGGE